MRTNTVMWGYTQLIGFNNGVMGISRVYRVNVSNHWGLGICVKVKVLQELGKYIIIGCLDPQGKIIEQLRRKRRVKPKPLTRWWACISHFGACNTQALH